MLPEAMMTTIASNKEERLLDCKTPLHCGVNPGDPFQPVKLGHLFDAN